MKKNWLAVYTLLFAVAANTSFAQVGRNELPRDTTPIGGRQQTEKMNRMEGKDEVLKELTMLRDSVNMKLTSLNNNGSNVLDANKQRHEEGAQALTKYKAQLSEAIDKLQGKDGSETASLRQSYQVLDEVREGFAKYRKDLDK